MEPIQSKEKLKQVGEFYHRINEVHQDYLKYWMKNTVFHWDFWVSIFFVLFSVIFWIVIRKKESSNRLLFSGMFVLIITSWFDLIGAEYGKWYYTGVIIPTIPSFVPWDWFLIPILVMTLIQIKPKISPIFKGLIFAAVSVFIGEPLFIWLGLYVMVDWHLAYSFPIYFIIYLIAHRLSKVKSFESIAD